MRKIRANLIITADSVTLRYIGLYSRGWVVVAGNKKYFLKERYGGAFLNEVRWLAYLDKCRFPFVPAYCGTILHNKNRLIVQEYVEGAGQGGVGLSAAVPGKIIDALSKLHAIRQRRAVGVSVFICREMEQLAHHMAQLDSVLPAVLRKDMAGHLKILFGFRDELHGLWAAALPGCDERIRPSLVNRQPDDFALTKDGRILLLDWEEAGFGDPAEDLAKMLLMFPPHDHRKTFLLYRDRMHADIRTFRRSYVYAAISGLTNLTAFVRDLAGNVLLSEISGTLRKDLIGRVFQKKQRAFEKTLLSLRAMARARS